MRQGVVSESEEKVRPTVLIVDDEPAVLESVAELLRTDYEVLATTDPEEAVHLLEERDVALILTDQRMPNHSGVELLARSARLSPDTVRVLFTGYSDIEAIIQGINEGRMYRYIAKPWDPEELVILVEEATRLHVLAVENERLLKELAGTLAVVDRQEGELGRLRRQGHELEKANRTLAHAVRDLNDAHWHLRKFQEFLPICSCCGRVRSEDGEWQPLREFLNLHSDFLTHGLCPECVTLLENEEAQDPLR
jgi:response regulator RpfG family c-di-GMP phosphodiesterase